MMRILVGYDGSEGADATLIDLQRAGLPDLAEALIVSVADVTALPETSGYEFAGPVLASRRLPAGLMFAQKQSERYELSPLTMHFSRTNLRRSSSRSINDRGA
jgi:hypothetical protein